MVAFSRYLAAKAHTTGSSSIISVVGCAIASLALLVNPYLCSDANVMSRARKQGLRKSMLS
ncbi:MAG: hypothetical protein R3E74_14665 [Pseudomonadales bacterium]